MLQTGCSPSMYVSLPFSNFVKSFHEISVLSSMHVETGRRAHLEARLQNCIHKLIIYSTRVSVTLSEDIPDGLQHDTNRSFTASQSPQN